MKNKFYILAFLAAAMIIAPNAAFGQNYGINQSMKRTAITTDNDESVNQNDSQNSDRYQSQIRSGSLCSSGGQFVNSNQASNQGVLVAVSYKRNQRVSKQTVQNRVNAVLRSFCN
jgi:hypothetical protein